MKPISISKDLHGARHRGARASQTEALRKATSSSEVWLGPSRISHADELQLACRLAECRREQLALALSTAECVTELRRLRAELAGNKLVIQDIVELGSRSAGEALDAFRHWIERVATLRVEAARARREARRAASAVAPAGPDATVSSIHDEAAPSSALVREFEFHPDMVTRLLGTAGVTTAEGVTGGTLGASLPPALERRYRALELEVARIRNRFLTSNQGLVTYVVQRYLGMGLSHDDLMQEGNIGLLRAVEKFDHRRGGRFGTYAVWWVRQGIRRALANQSRTIRVPVHALGARYSLDQAARRLALQLGREPSPEELSGATGVAAGNVAQLLALSKEPLSLDAPRGPDSDARLGDSIPDSSGKSSMVQAVERERSEQLGKLLCSLSQRERAMVRMRFGLDGSDECTLEQIGVSFSITRERVRQIVGAALEKLNRQTRALQLELRGGAE